MDEMPRAERAQTVHQLAVLLAAQEPPNLRARSGRFVRRQPVLAASGLVIVLILFVAVFGEAISPHSYSEVAVPERLLGPSWEHPFGTDNLGRDMLARVIAGARTSVLVGLAAALLGTSLAVLIGLSSGFVGGYYDMLIQRLVDAIMAFPTLILLITIVSLIGTGLVEIVVAISFSTAVIQSRTIRSAAIATKAVPYVEAATVVGATQLRIARVHILPNIMSTVLVIATLAVGFAILIEAALSFLGHGIPPPRASWGRLMSGDSRMFMFSSPWLGIFPGLAITITVIAVNMFGDSIRDLFDPRLRRRA